MGAILFLGVENSYPDKKVRFKIYQMYYQLLLHEKLPLKDTKLLLLAPAHSGKTS